MDSLNSVCDGHGHDPGLPDADLRQHVLASAIRTAEAELAEHGYADVGRGMEVPHVAMEDAADLDDETGE